MNLDQHARARAADVRSELSGIDVPDPAEVLGRASRRRRTAGAAAALVVVVVLLASVAIARTDGTSSNRVEVRGGGDDRLPAGAARVGDWTMIPKRSSGIDAGETLTSTASDGSTVLVGGRAAGDRVAGIWRSPDGLHWAEADHPRAVSGISAIALHDGTALAIGAPGEREPFVWRSDDEGRHWREVAHGPIFGRPVPNNRPGAFVSGLLWHDGWWVAYGGAADGYEGIWISRDGVAWQAALDSLTSGGIDGIVSLKDGSLMAYGVDGVGRFSFASVGWFTSDPTSWGSPQPIVTPDPYSLTSVARGAALAVGESLERHAATVILRSADNGRSWTQDPTFRFPHAWAFTATRSGDLDTITGTDVNQGSEPGPSRVWISKPHGPWASSLPDGFGSSTLPTTTIPQVPPGRPSRWSRRWVPGSCS